MNKGNNDFRDTMASYRGNEKEQVVERLKRKSIDVDEPFQFQCSQCGKCCINRDDIVLDALDVYRLSKELDMEPQTMIETYGEVYIGSDSGIPIVRLCPRGSIKRCIFLKDRKCSVHKAKPTVCALYPLGRYIMVENVKNGNPDFSKGKIQYIFNSTDCGGKGEMHTAREWLANFEIPLDDSFFMSWSRTISMLSISLRRIVTQVPKEQMEAIWYAIYVLLYLNYNTKKDFRPQFEKNAAGLLEVIHSEMKGI